MSSLSKIKGRYYLRLSPGENEARPKIFLGIVIPAGAKKKEVEIKQDEAQKVHRYIDDLIRCMNGQRIEDTTAAWIKAIDDRLRKRLEVLGLIESREKQTRWTVAAWVADYIDRRLDVKEATRRKWRDVESKLAIFFKDDSLDSVTKEQAKNFRIYLQTVSLLSENTLRRHIGITRQFFNAAIDAEIITKNPFRGQSVSVRANESRFYYLSVETAQKVLDACPDSQWRLIFGLARWGGLRCPSEIVRLKWQDVDFDKQRFTVHSPKTEHHADCGVRIVPMFPELKPLFQDAYDSAKEGAVYCVESYRGGKVNLRTQLGRILKRAGIAAWPKLFQNCRSTRETELFKMTGGNLKAVCSWLGNSPAVAMAHYAQVTDADMKQAAEKTVLNHAENTVQNGGKKEGQKVGHNQGQSIVETTGDVLQDSTANDVLSPCDFGIKRKFSELCETSQIKDIFYPMGETGLEPVTSRV
ncbi:MAG: integrase [Planctomycetes bacterium]|nr:integrase [Planctomycetota bacterium]